MVRVNCQNGDGGGSLVGQYFRRVSKKKPRGKSEITFELEIFSKTLWAPPPDPRSPKTKTPQQQKKAKLRPWSELASKMVRWGVVPGLAKRGGLGLRFRCYLISRSETWVPKRGGLKAAGKRQESATFLQRSFFDVAVQFSRLLQRSFWSK